MLGNKRVLAVIPARAGSVGLPGKNIKYFKGKPLLAWSIEAAVNSNFIDDIIVSTDSEEYAFIAKKFGAEVPFLRPEKFSGAESSLISVLDNTLSELSKLGRDYQIVICLQPTSPLRTVLHIDESLTYFENIDDPLKSVASVYRLPEKFGWIMNCNEKGQLRFIDSKYQNCNSYNRQKITDVFMPNGAIFIMQTSLIKNQYTENTYPYVMSELSSLDIDTNDDFTRGETINF